MSNICDHALLHVCLLKISNIILVLLLLLVTNQLGGQLVSYFLRLVDRSGANFHVQN